MNRLNGFDSDLRIYIVRFQEGVMKVSMKSKPASFYFEISDKQVGINILIVCVSVLVAKVVERYLKSRGI